ncbi:MAG: succinate dehydrogenase assembly factor 2 [Neisseriaceae bacterium]|nr:succinate dehydrogenase assembly factor 2 [Neisseriaceae bacterium]
MTDSLYYYQRQVRWQMRRGLLELDIIFNRFIADANGFLSLDEKQLKTLENILRLNDQELLQVLQGSKILDQTDQVALVAKIQSCN